MWGIWIIATSINPVKSDWLREGGGKAVLAFETKDDAESRAAQIWGSDRLPAEKGGPVAIRPFGIWDVKR